MLIAISVVFSIVVLAVLLVPRRSYESVKVVDTSDVVESALRVAPYPVLRPGALPDSWRATSARITVPNNKRTDPTTLHIGYVTPTTHFAALEESNEQPVPFIRLLSQRGEYDGTVKIGDFLWVRLYSKERDVRSLVHATGLSTTVVTGNAPYDELLVLARSLR